MLQNYVLHQSVGSFLIVMVTTSGEVSKQNFYKRSHAKTLQFDYTLTTDGHLLIERRRGNDVTAQQTVM